MQKTFIKYTAGIVTIAVLLILFINFIFSFHMLETQQFETFYAHIVSYTLFSCCRNRHNGDYC